MQKISLNKDIYERVLIDQEKCSGCKKCMEACPMLDKYCDNPKDLLKELTINKEFSHKMPYSCMLCNYCTEVCPEGIDLNSLFLDLRNNVVDRNKGRLPIDIGTMPIDVHQIFSFSSIFTTDIEGLKGDTVFFPGCDLMGYSPEIVEKVYNHLKSKIDGLGIYIQCCGYPTLSMGKAEKFKEYYSDLEREFKEKNVKRVITGCEKCLNTIGEHSKNIEVVSLWEVIGEIGVPMDKVGLYVDLDYDFTIQDPCAARKIDKVHLAIRKIIEEIGIKVEEMDKNKSNSICCGSGGMVNVLQNEIAKNQIDRLKKEAELDHIITYSQNCAESIRESGKKSYHLLDLLFRDDLIEVEQRKKTTFEKWKNRYKIKLEITNK